MKVLIVDDSEIIRKHLIQMLSDLKEIEIVGEAKDVSGAINSFRKHRPDAVILDIRLPGGSGINVLEKIKNDSSNPIVIMLTNYPYPQYRKKCEELGADFFFDKATEFEKVIDVFKKLINK